MQREGIEENGGDGQKPDEHITLSKNNEFELFGYDFMIDQDFKVYLIEVNTNPCIETSPCPLLQRLITQLLDQTFKITLDPFLQPATPILDHPTDPKKYEIHYSNANEMSVSEFQYEMVYSNYEDVLNNADSFVHPAVSPRTMRLFRDTDEPEIKLTEHSQIQESESEEIEDSQNSPNHDDEEILSERKEDGEQRN